MQDYTEDLLEMARMEEGLELDGQIDSDSGDLASWIDDYID